MILISDTADTTRRAQMDLVLARAEAASIPIHAFGYGRSHDPASLWLISNHTSGTYTFVKDWYDLQGCIAGCVGGMMSIALRDMKLHLKIVDGQQFKIRKLSGGPLRSYTLTVGMSMSNWASSDTERGRRCSSNWNLTIPISPQNLQDDGRPIGER
jgi:hypothetical protein